jgi:gluconokinase
LKNNPLFEPLQTCHLVVMGVSGCGKSTLGTQLAQTLQMKFIEGDDYHSPQSVEKMKAGHPLTDQDRIPWLNQLAQVLRECNDPAILSCSALKHAYREILQSCTKPLFFIHLALDRDSACERLKQRTDHFFEPSLLDDQLAQLEPLKTNELGITLRAELSSNQLTHRVLRIQ